MSTRVEPCACGDLIVAIGGQEPLAVEAHNATKRHRAWRAAGGMWRQVYGPEPTGEPLPVPAPAWDPTEPVAALAAALASQTVVDATDATWRPIHRRAAA